MQVIQQFFLLLLANIKRVYGFIFGVTLYLIVVFFLYVLGFVNFALAVALFLSCVIARPSVELKNLHYVLWSLRFSPIILLHVFVLKYVCFSWVITGLLVPMLIFTTLYILDSGLYLKRLLYAPLGILKMYWYTSYICVSIGMFFALCIVFMPFIITMFFVIPVIVTLSELVYYKYLYEQFRIYYAAD